jgi:hypothetical protein
VARLTIRRLEIPYPPASRPAIYTPAEWAAILRSLQHLFPPNFHKTDRSLVLSARLNAAALMYRRARAGVEPVVCYDAYAAAQKWQRAGLCDQLDMATEELDDIAMAEVNGLMGARDLANQMIGGLPLDADAAAKKWQRAGRLCDLLANAIEQLDETAAPIFLITPRNDNGREGIIDSHRAIKEMLHRWSKEAHEYAEWLLRPGKPERVYYFRLFNTNEAW